MHTRIGLGLSLAVTAALAAPGAATAATTTFGSDLTAQALLDTAANVQPQPHSASDTYLWNTHLANGSDPRSPASGQITDIKVKGCTNAANGPVAGFNITGIEFQDLAPQADGSFLTQGSRTSAVDAAGNPFALPLCSGAAGGSAGADTVTDYRPVNLCTTQGDSVDFTDNGGFDLTSPLRYPDGVPYQVLARVASSSVDSYVLYAGGQEKTFKPGDVMFGGGFYVNPDTELLLQATVGTGPDGTGLCSGGTKGLTGPGTSPPPPPVAPAPPPGAVPTAAVRLSSQRDGVNHRGIAKVSIFCALPAGCSGTAALSTVAGKALAAHGFSIPGRKTSKVSIRLSHKGVALLRKHHRKLAVTLSVTVAGQVAQTAMTLKL